MNTRQLGFTLLELIVVMIIVAILAVISFPKFTTMEESSYDQEAIATLKIIQDAEKYYYLEKNSYYSSLNITAINSNLSLNLPTGITRAWDYVVYDTGCVEANRYSGPAKTWYMEIEDDEPKSTGGGCS